MIRFENVTEVYGEHAAEIARQRGLRVPMWEGA